MMDSDHRPALLLVEDNPADADLVQEFLERAGGTGYRVLLATRVEQALRQLREQQVDVVLLDLRLPDGSGVETVKAVLTVASEAPVIVLTGTDDQELALSCIDAGADDYLYKGDIQPNLLHRSIGYSITRRREMQARQQQVRRLVSSSPDAVVVTDAKGKVRFANDAAFGLFGRDRRNFIGDRFPYSVAEGQVHEIEIDRAGVRRVAEMRVAAIEWEGDAAYLASIRDNTERRLLEEKYRQSQKMEAIGRLAGGVAHDFNNLLTVILGSAEMLREVATDPRTLALVADISTAGERAASLARQLLAFGRQSVAASAPVDVNALVRETERLLRRLIGEDVQLVVSLAADLPKVVADSTQVTQVVMNLAVNARDAMPHGGRLSISTARVFLPDDLDPSVPGGKAGDFVAIAVTDTGMGMDAATRARIFEPFFTTKAAGKGTGLGLATVYGFVTQSGGRIAVESEPGCGTCIRVYLPVPSNGEKRDTPAPDAYGEAGSHEVVLLVEDEETVREVTAAVLRRIGYRVIEAVDGEQALDKARTLGDDFDLLLTDSVMPGMGGAQLAAELRRTRPNLPVVLMSGYSEDTVAGQTPFPPDVKFLRKPFMREALAGALRDAFAGRPKA